MSLSKYFLILLFIAVPNLCLGQWDLDVKIDPQPYTVLVYQTKKTAKPIRQIVFIKTYDIEHKGAQDTINLEKYDAAGNKTQTSSYMYGKKVYNVDYTTSADSNVKQWRRQKPGIKQNITTDKIVYNKAGTMSYFENVDMNYKGDTLGQDRTNFVYNNHGLLLKREQIVNKKPSVSKIYAYKDKDMIKAEFTNPYNPDNYSIIEYTYNTDHLPVEKKESMIRKSIIEPSFFNHYGYEGKKLVTESYTDNSNPGEDIKVDYTYDEKDRMLTLTSKQDTLCRIMEYQYEGKHLKKIIIKSNSRNKFNRELYIFSINRLTVMPYTFEREYAYDENDNLIETKESLNGVLQRDIIQKIIYY